MSFTLQGEVWWRIQPSTPAIIPNSSFGVFRVVNPAAYELVRSSRFSTDVSDAANDDGVRILRRTSMMLSIPDEFDAERDFNESFDLFRNFLKQLRFYSRQATLPLESSGATGPLTAESSLESVPAMLPTSRGRGMINIAFWAVTESDVENAASHAEESVPIYHELFSDAQKAAIIGDSRNAILFAAMAIETLAGTVADNHGLLIRSSTPSQYPIFEFLRSRARFANLLHEVDLYCRGKSLLVSDHGLYQSASRLYRTRNKIAHQGTSPSDESFIPLTSDGANEALDTAHSLFEWFGVAVPRYSPFSPKIVP